jgi:hypothetical protein
VQLRPLSAWGYEQLKDDSEHYEQHDNGRDDNDDLAR